MEFRIADTFTDSLARLTGEEQKAAKTAAFDLQLNPASPGLQLHKLERARDKGFWSVRASRDLRLIVHRTDSSLLLCFVGHHDDAYRWAERRRLERHPTTGAAQLVELRETVREIEVPRYVDAPAAPVQAAGRLALFAERTDGELLGYGVPTDWLGDVRCATEDTLFDIAEHLPAEAAEALLVLATGGTPQPPLHAAAQADPFAHPDAQRRFRVMANAEELQLALESPWDRWIVFLHPAQRSLVERHYTGPARVCGSAGTGKTIVALHRAVHLARAHPTAAVLLTTFSDALARALHGRLERLTGSDLALPARITVEALDRVAVRLCEARGGAVRLADAETVREALRSAAEAAGVNAFPLRFLESEWRDVVDAWQLERWEAYRDVPRLGRKRRLGEQQRAQLWSVFERVRAALAARGLSTLPGVFGRATAAFTEGTATRPFDIAVVDEAQDLGVPQLRFLAALAGTRPDALFFSGDLGQRIFQTPFSWRQLGVDLRGRSQTLRICYRTSHQIRRQADRLLPTELSDVDGTVETRGGTTSALSGPEPSIRILGSIEAEQTAVADWLRECRADGVPPHELGIIVRAAEQLDRAKAAARIAELPAACLDESWAIAPDVIRICTMHLAKGLEFRGIAVMACDDEVLPLQERIEGIGDESDLEEVYATERHLLYVACTRARDHLLVTGVDPASEFLDDLQHTHLSHSSAFTAPPVAKDQR